MTAADADADRRRLLRVLHLTAGSDAGGLSRYIHDLGVAMAAGGHQIAIAGQRGAWHEMFRRAPQLTWIDVPLKGGPLSLWRAVRKLRTWLDENPVDVLHTHYRRAVLVARRLQRGPRTPRTPPTPRTPRTPPLLYSLHLSHMNLSGPRRWFSDFGDHTHCAATEAKSWLIEEARVPETNISYIPHGIDPAKWPLADDATCSAARAKFGLSDDDRVAVYVGRLDTPKNEQWVLDVADKARHAMPNLRILMAGDGPNEPAVRKRMTDDGLGDRVILLGNCDPLPVYQAADALLLPSEREGFSLVCAEAMSVGIPVLRTRTSGTRELIVEDVTGRSVPINRERFVAEAINFLSDLPNLRRMGAAAADHVRKNFTFDLQLARTIGMYRSLAGKR